MNDLSSYGNTIVHHPVLVNEVLAALDCKQGEKKIYVDCTIGLGGHSERILDATASFGKVIGIDRDEEGLHLVRERLRAHSDRLILRKGTFQDIVHIIADLNVEEVDGFLFDLGVSSLHLDNAQRGFSFQKPGPLDMRMDRQAGETASDLVNRLTQGELEGIIQKYGEERWAGRIASGIVRYRKETGKITQTQELEGIIWRAVPSRFRHGRLHPATRTFQALRMVVNNEMEQIETGLIAAISLLAIGGRIAVISFHSLEDRSVKRIFRHWSQRNEQSSKKRFVALYKKPVTAGPDEKLQNRRARSAKLRVLERAA